MRRIAVGLFAAMALASFTAAGSNASAGRHSSTAPSRYSSIAGTEFPGQHHAAHLRRRQDALQYTGTTALPHIDLRHAEHRRAGGQDDVATRRQHEPGAQRSTVHRGNHWLAAIHQAEEHVARQPVGPHVIAIRAAERLLFLDVGAGAEHVTAGGQHDAAYVGIGFQPVEYPQHRLPRLAPQRIHRRSRQRYHRDVRCRGRNLNICVLHAILSGNCCLWTRGYLPGPKAQFGRVRTIGGNRINRISTTISTASSGSTALV